MPRSDEVTIQVSDLEDVRNVLSACLNFFQADDLQEAQKAYTGVRYSPLTNEIARIAQRFDGYMGDFLLANHEAASDESVPDEGHDIDSGVEEAEEPAEEATEASEEEPLAALPLGKPNVGQQGKRVSARRRLAEEQGEEVGHSYPKHDGPLNGEG